MINSNITTTLSPNEMKEQINKRRYWRIIRFFAGVIFHVFWVDIFLNQFIFIKNWVRESRPRRFRRLASRFRQLAIQMGGVMIKLGQFLSSRMDVLPVEITDELKGLQDEVPPVPLDQIQTVLKAECDDWISCFPHFEENPMAAASLGQVHRAKLKTDEAIVIKVQRPGIENIVRTDLAALKTVAPWVMRYKPIRRRADIPALIDEFSQTLWAELDYETEAKNIDRFGEMFADDDKIRIPRVYHNYSTKKILVMENVEGIKITDLDAITAAGVDLGVVAIRLFDAYFKQVFKEDMFHADPHPGNLFILPKDDNDEDGNQEFELVFVDFGMVGRVSDHTREKLQHALISTVQKDADTLVKIYNELGFFLPDSNLDQIAKAYTVVLDRIFDRNITELTRPDPREVREIALKFRDVFFDFPFQIPQNFIFLGRTLGMISGLCTKLDPEFNPWHQFKRYANELAKEEKIHKYNWKNILKRLQKLLTIPAQAERILNTLEQGQLQVSVGGNMNQRLENIEKQMRHINWNTLIAASVVSGTLLYLNGYNELAMIMWGFSGLVFLVEIFR